jgi:GNAT superfamily N-acetyltransferase
MSQPITYAIRPATPEDATGMAEVHVSSWRSTYAGIIPAETLAGLSVEQRAQTWREGISRPNRQSEYVVAVNPEGRIVGFACGGPERDGHPVYTGELYAIYLYQDMQGQGIGRALVKPIAAHLLKLGHRGMLVWVLAANPARHFYERLGGVEVVRKEIVIGGAALEEIGCGWADCSMLV